MIYLVRYADDFVITGQVQRSDLENDVKPLVEQFLLERGLELSEEKTKITHIQDGFEFLGKNIRKYKRKVLVKPSKKSVQAFLDKVREIIKENYALDAGKLVMQLNPLIRGWAQYYQHDAAKRTFSKIAYAIFQALWRWAKRRHRNKSIRWVARKYFWGIPRQTWAFHGEFEGKMKTLISIASIPVTRYIKVRQKANPYDPAWEVYFEERWGLKMARTLAGRKRLLNLWKEQGGICPVCNQKITTITSWHNHHLIWKSMGGSDQSKNRVLLHPNCHNLVHSRKLTVEKPRPSRSVREA